MAFHASTAAARNAGFRPCARCRPEWPPKAEREASLIAKACRLIETAAEAPALNSLATASGLSPHHFHRVFKRVTGVTPGAYAAARRQARVQEHLSGGAAVTDALYAAGFNSSGRFYESAPAMLGMKPRAYAREGVGENIWFDTRSSSLGEVLVAATERGVCAILIGEQRRVLVADLRERFARASFVAAPRGFASLVAGVIRLVDRPHAAVSLPLDIRGTAFQRQVWEALRSIKPGETTTYSELAMRIGRPRSVRAVASACAANVLAVAIPCHRVIGANGSLSGYRWGIERKRRLLELEKPPRKSRD